MSFLDKIRSDRPEPTLVLDPVCGMRIEPADSVGRREHEGRTAHFCSASCQRKFDADPAKYAGKLTEA